MTKVIDIEEKTPYKVSETICIKCGTRGIDCRPADVKLKDLECPKCGKGYMIETGEEIYE